MKPRILQVNTVANSRSTGRIAEDLGRLAMENGFDSYFAYGRERHPSASTLYKIGNRHSVFWHGLRSILLDQHGFGSTAATHRLISFIKENKISLLHLHNVHGYYLNIKVLFNYIRASNIPTVWTLHDCWAFTGHCAYFDFVGCNKWKELCYDCPQLSAYPKSILCDNSKTNFLEKKRLYAGLGNLKIITPSAWLLGLLDHSILNEVPRWKIANGVDTEVFKPRQYSEIKNRLGIGDQFILLGVASRWEPRKGLADFFKLSSLLGEGYMIILVGLDKGIECPENIMAIPRTESQSELAALYGLADVFVNPTYEDNFPTTNLEALASGTPVISYKTGGSVESVDAGTGYLIEKGDIADLLLKVKNIKKLGKAHFSVNCRNRALSMFNKNTQLKKYIDVYKEF